MNAVPPDDRRAATEGREAANRAATQRAATSGYLNDVQVYEPHRVGLPPLVPYFTELWSRREFAGELSRTELRASHSRTLFGQIWLVLNPLLLAGVYYVLVGILARRPGGLAFLTHLVAGLFVYYFVAGCLTAGAKSVTGGGSLIANMAFPRLLMPMAAVRTAFFRFLPTLPVYFIFHIASGQPWGWATFGAVYFLACIIVFATGLAAIFATLQVYFRDTMSFLPYFVRVWLYLSPILWFAEDVPDKLRPFMIANPLYPMLGGWTDTLVRAEWPPTAYFVQSAVWAVAAIIIGFLYFISREREFAVRL